jgi:MoaA/NifB/PqqE/SkfB family radical SAM enzyme
MSKRMRGPGVWETVKELLLGRRRMMDCVQVEVSSRCHGRCVYCPHTVFQDRWHGRDMEMETFERLWPLMRQADRVHLQGWGEPLLQPAFFEMTALARRAGCAVSTTTCGLGLTDATAAAIVKSGIDIIAFSLAGTDNAANAGRKGVSFEQVCASVQRLQSARRAGNGVHLEIRFAYLLLASCMESVRRLPQLMQRLGVHAAVISTLDYLPHPGLEEEAFLPTKPQQVEQAAAILAETAAEAQRLDIGFHYRLPSWDNPVDGCTENVGRTLFVSADGTVSPCVFLNVPASAADNRRRIFGNIRDTDPLGIWEEPRYKAFRERLAQGDPDSLCLACPKRFMG